MTPQLDADGRLRHLLTLEGLPRATLVALLDRAQAIVDRRWRSDARALAGTAVCTLFFEPSTRTRLSFQRAAQRLGADVLNFDASTSSTTKGETALDTLKNIEAMGVHGFVVRHADDGAVAALAAAARARHRLDQCRRRPQRASDAGAARHADPAPGQGRGFLAAEGVDRRRRAPFARRAFRPAGVAHAGRRRDPRCGPRSLLPDDDTLAGCVVGHDLDAALDGVDAVMMLRLQRERMDEGLVSSLEDYHRDYGLTASACNAPRRDAVVMHPGPMNRGVEIDDAVADGPQSLILEQVANGVAVRMAVLEALLA